MMPIKVMLIMACVAIIGVAAHGPGGDRKKHGNRPILPPCETYPPFSFKGGRRGRFTLPPGVTLPPGWGCYDSASHDKDYTRPTLAPGETYPPWHGSRDRDFRRGRRKGKWTIYPSRRHHSSDDKDFTRPSLAPGETYPPRSHHDSHDRDFTRPTLAPGETYPPRRHPPRPPFNGGDPPFPPRGGGRPTGARRP